jgi:hypothetical protein
MRKFLIGNPYNLSTFIAIKNNSLKNDSIKNSATKNSATKNSPFKNSVIKNSALKNKDIKKKQIIINEEKKPINFFDENIILEYEKLIEANEDELLKISTDLEELNSITISDVMMVTKIKQKLDFLLN